MNSHSTLHHISMIQKLIICFILLNSAFYLKIYAQIQNCLFSDSVLLFTDYDSVDVRIDSLRGEGNIVSRLAHQTDYYKKINGVMSVVKRNYCLQKSMNSERSDCWIYILKDGELVLCDYLQGAE